jgi:formyl-CoA transferase
LEGVRVLDISRVIAGPLAAQTLADLGAEVIKIERPGIGDDTRTMGPHFGDEGHLVDRSAFFWAFNRGKRSVAIDLASAEGAGLVRQLASKADVIIENFKVGVLARYGLGYAHLAEVNPRLVYCSITGFGQTGPYRERAGYDTVVQAMGGLMSLTGEPDGTPGSGPQRVGMPMIDMMTGIYASTAVIAALRHRDRTGKGQLVDVALLDVMVSALSYAGVDYLTSGGMQPRVGTRSPVTYPSGVYACSDGQIIVVVGNDDQFARFCKVLGTVDLLSDPRFSSSPDRVRNSLALDEVVVPEMARLTKRQCLDAFERAGIPAGPINDLPQVFADPHIRARNSVVEMQHPSLGPVRCLASPMRLSESPVCQDNRPPLLGEHTREVLRDLLDLSDEGIEDLRTRSLVQ